MTVITYLLAGLVLLLVPAMAAGPGAAEPMLRVETGRHQAMVRRLAVDPGGQWFASVSYDKTVRLWSLADGRPLRVLRPPIGLEFEGALYGIAVTPDGRHLAVAGWTPADGEDWAIYLLDLQASEPEAGMRRIAGLPARVNALSVSPDGKHLAACMRAGKGVRVYRLADLALAWADAAYGEADCLWAVHAPDGRLLTTSRVPESRVRLYPGAGGAPTSFVPPDGKDASSAVFDAEGARVAVGYTNSVEIDLLDGATLDRRQPPVPPRGASGSYNRVAWSADGRHLFAAGMHQRGDRFSIVRWAEGGQGASRSLAPARAWITFLAPTADGGLLYATAEPAIGAIDGELRPRFDLAPEGADFRDMGDGFLLSADGRELHLSLAPGGKAPARFSLADRVLERDPPAPDERFERPVDAAPGVTVAYAKQSRTPQLNGAPLTLARYDETVSHAVLGDGGVLIGGDWYLYRFDAQGRERWRRNLAGSANAVAATRDGRLAVAATGDGTLRWFGLDDGVEVLAAFLAADGKRWVAWTPEGFFDHAAGGGEELVGWHLDRGRERLAEFVGIGQLYQRFYRPDLVARKLAGTAEAEIKAALARDGGAERALAGLPPLPLIVNAWAEGAALDRREVELRLQLRDMGGGFGRVVVRVNGVAVAEIDGGREYSRAVTVAAGREDRVLLRPLTLEPGVNRVEVVAYNAANTVESRRVGRTVHVRDAPAAQPALFLLAVGIDSYARNDLRLRYAVADAAAIGAELKRRGRELFRDVVVVPVVDAQATVGGIAAAFARVAREAKSHDVFVLYMAGHGATVEGLYHYLPVDIAPSNLDDVRRDGLAQERLESLLASVPALKSVILLDTCHAGAFALPGARGLAELSAMDRLRRATGRAIMAASTAQQQALEGHEGHGVFTYALLAGLKGAAPTRGQERMITVNDLAQFVGDEVRRITKLRFGVEQIPVQNLQGASFPIALAR